MARDLSLAKNVRFRLLLSLLLCAEPETFIRYQTLTPSHSHPPWLSRVNQSVLPPQLLVSMEWMEF